MQDRYVGDVGDFGKYGLLRMLCAADEDPALSLGVVWYLVPDEGHNADGKHVGYLLPKGERAYRGCAPVLYDALRHLVMTGQRSVASIRVYGLLPEGTEYFESALVLPPMRRGPVRREWFRQALKATHGCDLVFLDPDNGLLEPGSTTISAKHARCEEVAAFVERGQSVVAYHHLGRQSSHEAQISDWIVRLRAYLQCDGVFALRFARGTGRAYFVIPAARHGERLLRRASRLVDGRWADHFELQMPGTGALA